MYSWVGFPLLRIALVFTAGIVAAVEYPIANRDIAVVTLLIGLGLFVAFYKAYGSKRFFSLNNFFGLFSHLLVFLTGYTVLTYQNAQYDSNHLLYQNNVVAYSGEIIEEPEEKERSHRLLLSLESIKDSSGWKEASGKLYVYVRKTDAVGDLSYGDKLIVLGTPNPTEPPKNPGEFNYKRYLSFQNIYHQDFVGQDEYRLLSHHESFSVIKLAIEARKYLRAILSKYVTSDRERAIALALILGAKDELTSDINAAYSAAGAMHVLAVSGLHVGIIYLMMMRIFKGAEKRKYQKWIFLIVTLLGLWSYALITGLSPSVLRAVTMFSFLTIAKVINRESSIYNTLAAAGLVLLCYNPYLIMSVGFQLSFLAVFGIVYMTPKLEKFIYFKQKAMRWAWTITCVSIAAQIATAPLTLLYFHQFPTYFFFSNLVVIPAATGILYGGIVLFMVSFIPLLNDTIGYLLEGLIYLTNRFVFFVDQLPYNTISNIYISTFQSWLIILIVMLYFIWRYSRQFQFFLIACLGGFILIGIHHWRALSNMQSRELTIYHVTEHTAIDLFDKGTLYSYIDSELINNPSKMRFHIKPNRLRHGATARVESFIQHYERDKNTYLVHSGVTIGIIRELAPLDSLHLDIAILIDQKYADLKQIANLYQHSGQLVIGSDNRPRVAKEVRDFIGEASNVIYLTTGQAWESQF